MVIASITIGTVMATLMCLGFYCGKLERNAINGASVLKLASTGGLLGQVGIFAISLYMAKQMRDQNETRQSTWQRLEQVNSCADQYSTVPTEPEDDMAALVALDDKALRMAVVSMCLAIVSCLTCVFKQEGDRDTSYKRVNEK